MYDYRMCLDGIEGILRDFPSIKIFEMGRSVMGKPIFCMKSGEGEKKILIVGAHHGLESLTSALVIQFLREYEEAGLKDGRLFDKDIKDIRKKVSIYAVPMLNPDGVNLAVHGIKLSNNYHRALIRKTGVCRFKKRWQANANGVDINHNYDADWQKIKRYPCATKYAGEYPESEPETRAMTDFIRREKFDALIAFHSQGEEIYYDFLGKEQKTAENIAKKMAQVSGYAVKKPQGTASFGGLKDWFISELGGLGFTVEIGKGKNPLPVSCLERILKENIPLILCLMEEISDKKQI